MFKSPVTHVDHFTAVHFHCIVFNTSFQAWNISYHVYVCIPKYHRPIQWKCLQSVLYKKLKCSLQLAL